MSEHKIAVSEDKFTELVTPSSFKIRSLIWWRTKD